jgi:sporulation protein YqfC
VYKSSSKITVHDNKIIYVENYKCILSAGDSEILIKTKKNIISVCGAELKIEYYCPEEIKISGEIGNINIKN